MRIIDKLIADFVPLAEAEAHNLQRCAPDLEPYYMGRLEAARRVQEALEDFREAIDTLPASQDPQTIVDSHQARFFLRQAFRDLLAQGCYGYEDNSCRMETQSGHSCVIGLLFKRFYPEIPLKRLGSDARAVLKQLEHYNHHWTQQARTLAYAAQRLHDVMAHNQLALTLDNLKACEDLTLKEILEGL